MSDSSRSAEQIKIQNMALMGDELGELYSALWQQVTWLYTKWGEYLTLFGTKQSRIELLNSTAPAFFKTVQDSLWEDVLLHITRITDSPKTAKKDNLSFLRLPGLILDSKLKVTTEQLLTTAIDASAFARDWRNRRIAHSDLKLMLLLSAEPLAAASRSHVQSTLSALAAVLNCISNSYLNSTTMFEFCLEPSPGGALTLLHYLHDGQEAKTSRKERVESGIFSPEDIQKRNL